MPLPHPQPDTDADVHLPHADPHPDPADPHPDAVADLHLHVEPAAVESASEQPAALKPGPGAEFG